jgi:hypothetical protein
MTTLVMINFFKSLVEGEHWIPIPKDEMPEKMLTDGVMERMLDGLAAYDSETETAYIVMRAENIH